MHMNMVFAFFVGWTMLLMGLRSGRASSILYDRFNDTGLTGGEKRQFGPRAFLLRDLIQEATGLSTAHATGILNYGCWCGQRGGGKIVDNFDYCCKVHDFCENDLSDNDKCGGNLLNIENAFEYDETTRTCTPANEYSTTNNEEARKCGYSVCLCDMEMVRCMGHYKNDFNANTIGYNTEECPITGAPSEGQSKVDVVVLIQDSQGISTTTVEKIKEVVRRFLTLLDSADTDYNFALAVYARSRRMSCFGNANETIGFMEREYRHGRRGTKNLFKRALSKMILKQFDARPNDRGKILVLFSDGRAERGNGDVFDTFRLEKTAKQLREKDIKIVGVLIPNTQNTQRIQELKGIVSSPIDALDAEFSASSSDISDLLAFRVKKIVAPKVKYTVKVFTPDSFAFVTREYKLTVRIIGQGNKKTNDQELIKTTEETQGNLNVIKSDIFDEDVDAIRTVEILPDRVVQGSNRWTLEKVEVTKGTETVTAVFNKRIPTWPYEWESASATSSDEETEA